MTNLPVVQRKTISAQDLHDEIDRMLAYLTAHSATFTAYGVTMALRQANPNYEIVHNEVRQRVRFIMRNNQNYDTNYTDYVDPVDGNVTALTWFPMVNSGQPTLPVQNTVQISAPVNQANSDGVVLFNWKD